ncbi:MAG: extracellular solute-binding protein [Lachnospiraceae bacterium]|nr:extracellular solute-binding protein [Lachnospiraceae bacterium]
MKKQNQVTRLLSLLLVLSMLFTACAKPNGDDKTTKAEDPTKGGTTVTDVPTDAPEPEYPEYLNLDSAYPIIKDEHEGTIKLTAVIGATDYCVDWDDLWISKYFKDKYNVEIEAEIYRTSTLKDKKQILLNSGEIPDLLINMEFSTSELVKYGVQEGLFLPIDEYIDETLTPNLVYYYDGIAAACTGPDGHMYTLPKLTQTARDPSKNLSKINRAFINKGWLDDLNIPVPTTLDEYVSAMYAVKAADPAGVGVDKFYPVGGNMTERTTSYIILNALGYNVRNINAYGIDPTLRDGEVVIPAYDMEVYQEYLKIMHDFYKDGIVHPDLFTLSNTEVDALASTEVFAVYGRSVSAAKMTQWAEWTALTPLTSDWQTEPEFYEPTTTSAVGGFVISADTKYPELCMRFADMLFNNQTDVSRAILNGLDVEPYNTYGDYVLCRWDDEEKTIVAGKEIPGGVNFSVYLATHLSGSQWAVGAYTAAEANQAYAKFFGGTVAGVKDYDMTDPSDFEKYNMVEYQFPYLTTSYPDVYYASPEQSAEIVRLLTVLDPYIKENVAKFIVGERDLSEVNEFQAELKNLGADDLLQIYKDIYDSMTK